MSTATRVGAQLTLFDTRVEGAPSFDGVRERDEYLIVPWDNRTYLLPEGTVMSFCNAINMGYVPSETESSGAFFVHRDQGTGHPIGRPDLPPKWARFILDSELSSTTGTPNDDGTSWVNLGSSDGIQPGMELVVRQLPTSAKAIQLDATPFTDKELEIVTLERDRFRVQLTLAYRSRGSIPAGLVVAIGQNLKQ